MWRAFDTDLRTNLDTLEAAFQDELRERLPPRAAPTATDDPFVSAARETMDRFRLNAMYAEIRRGPSGEILLARLAGAGVSAERSLLGEAAWQSAEDLGTRFYSVGNERRAVVRSIDVAGGRERITLAVADRTDLVAQNLSSTRRALIEIASAGLLLALLGGSWIAGRALHPIHTLTTQADRMSLEETTSGSERLQVRNRDDELGRLAATFNRLLDRIAASIAEQRAFVADAAHELKTPVTLVRTEAELCLSVDREAAEYRESLRAIQDMSAHLSRLVSDLTLLAEGETLRHPLERRLVDLNELVHEVTRSLRPLAVSRRVTLAVESPGGLECRGDERLLRQIFTNLVENAIKFSPTDGRIAIVLANGGATSEVRVVDEAPTLSERDRARVFERFYRAPHGRATDVAGSGLGLAIVRWAVMLHGGSIRVEPRSPRGNSFIAAFPTEPATKGTAPRDGAETST